MQKTPYIQSLTSLDMVFYHHNFFTPYFYIPMWMEDQINWWFPQPQEITIDNACITCKSCATCINTCEMCLECNQTHKLNIKVEPFVPEEQIEKEFIRANPWIDE